MTPFRIWRNGILALGVVMAAASAHAQTVALEALEANAVQRHPAVATAQAQVDVARGRALQAGAWSNPSAEFGLDEWRRSGGPAGTFSASLTQEVLLGGKRSADRDVAAAMVAVAQAALDDARLRVRVGVRLAFYELAAAREKRVVAERLQAVADESVEIARQLMNVGLIDRPNLLEAEADAARQRARAAAARLHEAGAWRQLAIAAADPALSAGAMPGLADATLPALDRQQSLARTLAESPELREARAQAAGQRAAVVVEQRRMFPDLVFGGQVGWNRERRSGGGAKGWEFGVNAGVTLPLWNHNRGGLAAARSAATASEAAEAAVRLDVESRFHDAFEAFEAARVMTTAYVTDVLPRLEQAMTLNLTRYREMATPYPQVLLSQRVYVDAMGEYLDALDVAWQAAVRVEGLVVREGGR